MRKRAVSVDENFSSILRKIKMALITRINKENGDLFTYQELRAVRGELANIQKNYKRFFSPNDVETIKEITKILQDLRKRHPNLCSKEAYLAFLGAQDLPETSLNTRSTNDHILPNTLRAPENIPQEQPQVQISKECENNCNSISMELDESLMNCNNKSDKKKNFKPPVHVPEEIILKETQPPVASQMIHCTEKSYANTSNPIQKLYLQSLELWQCVDQLELEKKKNIPSKNNHYFPY